MAWLTGYNYRKSVTLSRASGAVSNYQMKLLVGESSGATGEDVDCGGKCLSTFNDIRFTTSDGTTLLDYWIESISGTTPNQLATVWIEFDSIGTGDTTFRMYYGNSEANAYSNGSDTFLFFDDFEGSSIDTGKWSGDTGSATVSSSICSIVGGASSAKIIYSPTFSGDIALRAKAKLSDVNYTQLVMSEVPLANNFLDIWSDTSATNHSNHTTAKNSTQTTFSNTAIGFGSYHIYDMVRNLSGTATAKTFTDGVENGSGSTTNVPTVDLAAAFRPWGTGNTQYCDWILVRKYLTTEPAWGAWGAEEIDQIEESLSISATMTPEQMVETIAESASISAAMEPELMVEASHDFVVVGAVMEGDTRSDSTTESAGISDLFSGYNITGDPPEELFREISELFGITASFSAANYYSKSITESLGLADASTPSLGLSITEILFVYDAIINGWGLTVDESLVLADTISDVLGLMISDWITLVDSQANNWNGVDTINDSVYLYDLADKYFTISDTVNESVELADTTTYKLTIAVLEYLGFTELATAMRTTAATVSESLALTETQAYAWAALISETLNVVDTYTVIANFVDVVQESLNAADTVSLINRLGLSLNESLVLTETVTSKGTLYNAVYDTLKMSVTVELGGEVYECYVLNTPKFMPSMYSGFNFNSYCVFENRAFGANDTGIYELTGTTDAGSTIHTGAILSQTDFGARNEKRFRRAYLGISGSAPVMIFETEEGARQVYNINSEGKTVISHELKSRKWKLSIADFDELDTIKLIPVILSK